MNAKIGPNNKGMEHVMGRHGIGNMNENGELFSELCANYDLIIGGTIFPHKTCHKVSWGSPDNITGNQIDHIAISKRFRRSLLDVRNKKGADIGSDHHSRLQTSGLKYWLSERSLKQEERNIMNKNFKSQVYGKNSNGN